VEHFHGYLINEGLLIENSYSGLLVFLVLVLCSLYPLLYFRALVTAHCQNDVKVDLDL
jgi:hypothetical protein